MPYVITTVLPPHVTFDMVRQVEAELHDVDPAGLIAHAVTYDDQAGTVRIVDLWESVKAHDQFAEQHLAPVVRRFAAAHGDSSPAPISSDVAEAVLFVLGRR